MKRILRTLIILPWLYLGVSAQSNNRKVYFLADTINVSKENRFMRIGYGDNAFEYFFIFFCKCAYPYKTDASFSYIIKKGEKKAEIVTEKPNYKYCSFRELMDMVHEHHNYFNDVYDLYITEVLPGNRYRTNVVRFNSYVDPTIQHRNEPSLA